ncbi:MAG: hypothetical protein ACFFFO_11115 [Candidatus Thorarchaeota archaeon]
MDEPNPSVPTEYGRNKFPHLCGLTGASPTLCEEIHEKNHWFQDILFQTLDKLQ